MLEARQLVKEVSSPEGLLTIVDGVSLMVGAAESIAVVGASGAGKSTLLALLAGLDAPTRGQVFLNGVELTALEQVMLPLELKGESSARELARAALEEVGLLARAGHYPRQLSGGEQQRVALARAFVTRPAVLFADEPTGNLDTATGARVAELLFALNSSVGTTLVLVSHERSLAARCDRVLELSAGKVVSS